MVESKTEKSKGEISSERRFYITSLPLDVAKIARAIRGHWGVENSLHWVLDVQMSEDSSRIRAGNAAENMARIRRLTINMLKNHEPGFISRDFKAELANIQREIAKFL